ncbi:MAG: PfkB family carbohydrate kinase [Pseudomonadota bacterium]
MSQPPAQSEYSAQPQHTAQTSRLKAVLAISSLVARGAVGLRAGGFAIERLGVPLLQVPTVTLPWHPGHAQRFGAPARSVPDDSLFSGSLQAIASAPFADDLGVVLTGYFVSANQVRATCEAIDQLREGSPELQVIVDPVSADQGGSYVARETIDAIAQDLVPRATLLTPNRFEAALLLGVDVPKDNAELVQLAAALPAPKVTITSAFGMMRDSTGVLLVEEGSASLFEHQAVQAAPNGTGDLFSALMAAYAMRGAPLAKAVERATASVFELVARSTKHGHDELMFAQEQDCLVRPVAMVHKRQLVRPKTKA